MSLATLIVIAVKCACSWQLPRPDSEISELHLDGTKLARGIVLGAIPWNFVVEKSARKIQDCAKTNSSFTFDRESIWQNVARRVSSKYRYYLGSNYAWQFRVVIPRVIPSIFRSRIITSSIAFMLNRPNITGDSEHYPSTSLSQNSISIIWQISPSKII